jgi:hypothetical protein
VSRIDDLAEQYEKQISAPWQRNLAGAQRTIFVVYPKEDERRLLVKLEELEHPTKAAGHDWRQVDLTNRFAVWMAEEEYREEYFRHPEDLIPKYDREFRAACVARLRLALTDEGLDDDSVLAVHGAGGLYGFTFSARGTERG